MTLILGQTAVVKQAAKAEKGVIEIPLTLNPQNSEPTGFNATLWALLRDIKTAGVPLTGKIAEYAGYFLKNDANGKPESVWDSTTTDNKNNPDVPYKPDTQSPDKSTGQPNKSLDKLTFLIMFRLPFLNNNLNDYYGDPLSDLKKLRGTPPTSQPSWSYRANELRTGTLRKLNEAGEQVNASNKRCDDGGMPLDSIAEELGTPRSFTYYNQIGSDLTGDVASAVKNYAPYFYLAITTEGAFKFPVPKGDTTLSVVQIPENIIGLSYTAQKKPEKSTLLMKPGPVLRRREVELGMYKLNLLSIEVFTPINLIPSGAPYKVDGALITKVTSGAHPNEYYVALPGPLLLPASDRVYVRLKYDAEEFWKGGAITKGTTIFEMDGLRIEKTSSNPDVYYAAYYATPGSSAYKFNFHGTGDIQFENLAIVDQSGVTLGWGYDIGQGDRNNDLYQYVIKLQIWVRSTPQPSGISNFRLRYKDRSSDPIAFDAPNGDVRDALLSLLRLKEKPWPDAKFKKPDGTVVVTKTTQTITVTSAPNPKVAAPPDPDYSTGWDISIIRANMDWNDIPPKRDFMEVPDSHGFFNIYSSNIFYQKDAANEPGKPNVMILPASEEERYRENTPGAAAWDKFTGLLTDLFGGVPWKDASHFTGATGTDIDDFENLLRGCLGIRGGNAFLPVFNHYTLMSKFNLPPIPILYPRWVEKLERKYYYAPNANSLPSDIFSLSQKIDRMNAAEKYVLITLWYRGSINKYELFKEAIRSKSLSKLVKVVMDNNDRPEREKAILDNLTNHFKKHLYRNIEED